MEATRAPFFKFVTSNDNSAAYARTRDAGDTFTLGKSRVVPGQTMKAMEGESKRLAPLILISAIDGGEHFKSPAALPPENSSTNCIGGCGFEGMFDPEPSNSKVVDSVNYNSN